jgi:hypothetical protein
LRPAFLWARLRLFVEAMVFDAMAWAFTLPPAGRQGGLA